MTATRAASATGLISAGVALLLGAIVLIYVGAAG